MTGLTFSNYQVLERLGAGGTGVVYKARDTRLNRIVALKFISPHVAGAENNEHVLQEARTASALDHPNIGVIYDVGEGPGGQTFIAMGYYDGGSLQERIRAGVSLEDAVEIARQASLGLAKAHEHGIVHRDIKPGNLMLAGDGTVKIIDFGLAKLDDATVTIGTTKGTPAFMSPEQARGERLDARSDIWSMGVVLYNMLAGRLPYRGDNASALLQAVLTGEPEPLGRVCPDLPEELVQIVENALQKDPDRRYQSAQEMARDLAVFQGLTTQTVAPVRRRRKRPWVPVAAVALVPVLAGAAWFVQRQRNVHWARQVALPEIARLAGQERNGAAVALAQEARQYLGNDPALAELWNRITAEASVRSDPPGAQVEIKDYLTPDAPWTVLGTTPLEKVRLPWGYSRVRISKPGYETFELEHQVQGEVSPDLTLKLDAAGTWPAGMVKVPWTRLLSAVANTPVTPVADAYYIDRLEVTNKEFQKFVDAGGYRDRRFWKEAFVKDGRPLPWEQAMALLVDATGEPGPATWSAGRFPEGQGDFPVTGVSWYEAAAYAAFAGKSLPTISHWYVAADPSISSALARLSNFESAGLAPAGRYQGLSHAGAYDMGGNVKEWCWNAIGSERYILGGSWRDPAYQFAAPDAQAPLDRSPVNGFRCVRYLKPPPAEQTAPAQVVARRDYSREKPVSDEVFKGYQALYVYDRQIPPAGKVEAADDSSPEWRKQRVTYDAGHGNERMPAYLFLPKNTQPPYQVVVYFPGSGVLLYPDSRTHLVAFYQLDYLIRGGRAVLYPIFEGTQERRQKGQGTAVEARDLEIAWSKEVERSLDYLETRPEIDRDKMAMLGFSLGVRAVVRMGAYPPRVKASIILSGGLPPGPAPPEVDLINFAPRLKVPTLVVNGRYDFTFPLETCQKPLFRLLGAPEKDKKLVLLEYAHNVGALPNDMRREVLAWLDRYLGPVK